VWTTSKSSYHSDYQSTYIILPIIQTHFILDKVLIFCGCCLQLEETFKFLSLFEKSDFSLFVRESEDFMFVSREPRNNKKTFKFDVILTMHRR